MQNSLLGNVQFLFLKYWHSGQELQKQISFPLLSHQNKSHGNKQISIVSVSLMVTLFMCFCCCCCFCFVFCFFPLKSKIH